MEEDEDAMTLWHQLVQNSVECELCYEPYSNNGPHIPRLLVCGHTFCEFCLKKWSLTTPGVESHQREEEHIQPERSIGVFASFTSAINASLNSSSSSADSNHSVNTSAPHGNGAGVLWIECPTCRNMTQLSSDINSVGNLPKNYELLRVRDEMQSSQTHQQLSSLKEKWLTQVVQKEHLVRDAKEMARVALHESEEAALKSRDLAKQVEINEQEKVRAQQVAEEAKEKAIRASHKAELLEAETEQLKQQLRLEASELQRLQSDATNTAAVAAELHTRAKNLQRQIDRVSAQLSLHSGRHDPAKLVVLVCEPTTVGNWLLPYTRYAVISITTENGTERDAGKRESIDPDDAKKNSFKAAKTWIMQHQVAEPSAFVKVYRRYSDFVWLHRQLCRKHPFELVPGIPGKQVFFNKENEFVGERMKLLQAFLRNVLRHPVLALVEEVRSFLLSTTEELDSIRLRSISTARDIDELEFGLCAAYPYDSIVSDSDVNERGLEKHSGHMLLTSKPIEPSGNAWAWGAMRAITNSAAKMWTTGNVSTEDLHSEEESRGVKLSAVPETNSSYLEDRDIDSRFFDIVECRENYMRVCSAYENTALKGSYLARAERKEAKHLHRICELLNDMDLLERSFDRMKRQRNETANDQNVSLALRESTGIQRQQQVFFETRTFDARAADSFSAFSLLVKSTADCNEYALLEIVRMQLLHLGAIEQSYSRLRQLEVSIHDKLNAAAKKSVEGKHTSGMASPEMDWNLQVKKLNQCRQELGKKVHNLDPTRSIFVLETLQENVMEMQILSKERRLMYEETLRQINAHMM